MKKEFTPGEWKQSHRQIPNDPDGMYSTQVYTEDGETICSLAWYPKPKEKGVHEGKYVLITGTYREANAKLIAAAPNMLDALMDLENDDNSIPKPIWDKVQNAIKKALTQYCG